MNMNKILLVLVVLSLVLAGVPAVPLGSVKRGLESGSISMGSTLKSSGGGSSPSHNTVIDIQAEIPDQVGGCF